MTADDLVDAISKAGGTLTLDGETLHFRLPSDAAHLARLLRQEKPGLLAIVRECGGRIATFPHCPRCANYALYRKDNIGAYECLTCSLTGIEKSTARRLVW